jgi:small subunit ribosomal protein S2
MKALLESGVHFGHRTNKWNPLMRQYIFTERNGIHILDLQQTVKLLDEAFNIVRNCVAEGGTILFVGTKRQAQETIQREAERCGMPYVNERWLGGTLTNWTTIQQRILELVRLEKLFETGEIEQLTKKEGLLIQRQINRLLKRLSGVRNMKRLPDLVFIVDIEREATAVHEANVKGIPIVAMVDTNCDPRSIDYIIPSNDDAIRAINLLVGRMADAVEQGKMERKDIEEEMVPEAPSVISRKIDEDIDLEDEDLLGTSTLAKIAPIKELPADIVEELAEELAVEFEDVLPVKEDVAEDITEEIDEELDTETEAVIPVKEEIAEVLDTETQAVIPVKEEITEEIAEEIQEELEEEASDEEETK